MQRMKRALYIVLLSLGPLIGWLVHTIFDQSDPGGLGIAVAFAIMIPAFCGAVQKDNPDD